jgi:hypothetical protein
MKKAFAFISLLTVASLITISCKKKTTTTTPAATTTSSTTGAVTINSVDQVSYSLNGVNHSYVSNGSSILGANNTNKSLGTNGATSTVIYGSDIDDGNSVTYLNIN